MCGKPTEEREVPKFGDISKDSNQGGSLRVVVMALPSVFSLLSLMSLEVLFASLHIPGEGVCTGSQYDKSGLCNKRESCDIRPHETCPLRKPHKISVRASFTCHALAPRMLAEETLNMMS